jgi:hypothetical protein
MMKKLMAIACLCAIAAVLPVQAGGNWKNRAYDATYTMNTSAGGPGTWRTAADGRGHALMETNSGGRHSFTLVDAPTSMMYIISGEGASKMAMKMPFNDSAVTAQTMEETRKRSNTPLGMKVVAGHPCHGFRYSAADGTTTDVWIGDDIDFMVASSTSSKKDGSTTSQTLQKFSPVAPPASSFAMPTGIKIMDMGGFSPGNYGAGQK